MDTPSEQDQTAARGPTNLDIDELVDAARRSRPVDAPAPPLSRPPTSRRASDSILAPFVGVFQAIIGENDENFAWSRFTEQLGCAFEKVYSQFNIRI